VSSAALDELKIRTYLDTQLIKSNPESGVIAEYGFQTQKMDEIMDNQWKIVLK
jgi:hypothetical protein